MNTAYGPVCDLDGLASTREVRQGKHGPELRHRAWATPATEFRHRQPARIPVDISHDNVAVGEVIHLEFAGRFLWAVAHLEERVHVPAWLGDMYWSSAVTMEPDHTDIEMTWLSLTRAPAQGGLLPLTFLPGALDYRGAEKRWRLDSFDRGLLGRAADARFHRRGGPIVIHDEASASYLRSGNLDKLSKPERLQIFEDQHYDRRPPGPLEWRPARILAVR